MPTLKGSKTEKNLLKAFAGESQARNRYTYFASEARNAGLIQISLIFEETANQEKEHAKRFFGLLEGGEVEITASFPAGKVGKTAENLEAAAAGEHHEHTELYPSFAKVAEEEGFGVAAALFRSISVAERQHEKRYRDLLTNLKAQKVFVKDQSVKWRCINCGFVFEGKTAPQNCLACAHPQAYFEVLGENW